MQWISDAVASLFVGGGDDSAPDAGSAAAPTAKKDLQTTGMLSKAQLLSFFDAARDLLGKPETKQKLKEAHATKKEVEDVITDMQKELFAEQGIDGDWGILCLGRINTEHRDDPDFIAAFYQFVMLEEAAVDEATMSSAAFESKQAMMATLEKQQAAFKARMEGMSPERRQQFLQQQQIIIAQMQQQQGMMAEKLAAMSQEERQDFIKQQMSQLEHTLQRAAEETGLPDAVDRSMNPDQQAGFLSQAARHGQDV